MAFRPRLRQIARSSCIVILLYPWLVSYDDVDSNSVQVTFAGGGGRYHQVQRDCGTSPTYEGDSLLGYTTDKILLDRRAPYWDASTEIRWNGVLENYGVRGGVLSLRDNGYVMDDNSLLSTHTYMGYGQPFQQRLLWYANPFLEIHFERESFGMHGSAGVWMGYVNGLHAQLLPSFSGGGNIDSTIFAEASFMSNMPLISGGGLLSGRLGARLGRSNHPAVGWVGLQFGAPNSGFLPFARFDVPLSDHFAIAAVGMWTPDEFSASSALSVRF